MLEETRLKISESNKGKIYSDESCRKMSEAAKNKPPVTDETRKKMSESANGHIVSEESRNRIREAHIGKHPSDKTRKKMAESKKGENNYMFEKHHTKEAIKKMSENHWDSSGKNNPRITKKEVILKILELLNEDTSITEIAKKIKISRNTVYKVKNGGYNEIYDLSI